jgi:VCBS repeat-containing protein
LFGWDTAYFEGDIRDYSVNGCRWYFTVANDVTGDRNELFDVEQLRFDNAEIYLDGRNNSPIADDLRVELHESSQAVSGNLLDEINAFDFEGDSLSIVSVAGQWANVGATITLPSGALLTVGADGAYSYDPNGRFDALKTGEHAVDTVAFTISDGTNTIVRDLVFDILGENDAPVAYDVLYVVDEDSVGGWYLFDAQNADAGDTEALLYNSPAMQGPDWIHRLPNPTTEAVNMLDGRFEIVAGLDLQELAQGELAEFSYAYTATDAYGFESNEAFATIRVVGLNDAPQALANAYNNILAGTGVHTLSYGVFDPDNDNSAADLAYAFTNLPPDIDIVDNGNGTFTIDSDKGFDRLAGGEAFAIFFTATDRHGATKQFSTFKVIGDNDAPVAVDDYATTDEDRAVIVDVLVNDSDIDGDTLAVLSVGNGAHGTTAIDEDGKVVYSPDADYFGEDFFDYEVSDGNGGTATARVNVTVNPVNDAPAAENTDGDYVLKVPGQSVLKISNGEEKFDFFGLWVGIGMSDPWADEEISLNGSTEYFQRDDNFQFFSDKEPGVDSFYIDSNLTVGHYYILDNFMFI